MFNLANIICGSPFLYLPDKLKGLVVGADKGALKLIKKKIDVDLAIGDFDSVTPLEFELIKEHAKELIVLPSIKDITDAEAAVIEIMKKGITHAILYGALGGRFDHQYGVIQLMLKYAKKGARIEAVDACNRLLVLTPGVYELDVNFTYVSFFALEVMVKRLYLSDVKYELSGYNLAVDDALCTSNEPLNKRINVSFEEGYLLVVMSSDC